jgi:D-tyrosyl-tRNA(Tyr) deacylase
LRVLLQRVSQAEVRIAGESVGAIESGLLLFVGFGRDDDESVIAPAVNKIRNLRVFPDDQGRFQFDIQTHGGSVLAVPQFTLYGDTNRGRRPDFTAALAPHTASRLFDAFVTAFAATGIQVETGRFGADMDVQLVNQGPVTLQLEFSP